MGFKPMDMQQIQQDLQQVNEEIQQLHMDEQQEQAFDQWQEHIRGQLAADQGSFAAKDEMQHLALLKVKLERDLAEITQLIQQENGTVAVTESARQQQAPVEVPPEEKPGVMKKVTDFFKNLFKKEQKPYPWYTKRQQKALLKRERKRDEKYAAGREANDKIAMELYFLRKVGGPEELIEEDYQQYYDLFTQNGWRRSGSQYDEKKDPQEKLGIQKAELQSFFRELGNQDCFNHVEENDGRFQMNVFEFSKEDIVFALSHPNEEGVQRILKGLFEIDFEKMEREYPMYKLKTAKEQEEMYRKWYNRYHRILGAIQWAEKFGEDKMSPEYKKEYAYRVARFNQYTGYISNVVTPNGTDLQEILDSIKEGAPTLRERMEHRQERIAFQEEIAMRIHKGEDFGDRQPAELYQELEEARFVTQDGRMRMSGLEPYEQLSKYAKEDINYYAHLELVAGWLMKHKQSELAGISEEEYGKLADYKNQFHFLRAAIFDGLGDGLSYEVRRKLSDTFNGPEGYWEKLFSHMDEYEQKKKAEKETKKRAKRK